MLDMTGYDADRHDEEIGASSRSSLSHHSGLWAELVDRVDSLSMAADLGEDDTRARGRLLEFLHGDVLPHLQAESAILYSKLRATGAETLAEALDADHHHMLDLVEEIEQVGTPQQAARTATALLVLVELRIEREETIVLPALAAAGCDVDALLTGVVVGMATEYGARFSYL